jgi:Fe-S-cluster-containing dehydrogenase component/anaerobic selenocysteine-containing dehydrogenase
VRDELVQIRLPRRERQSWRSLAELLADLSADQGEVDINEDPGSRLTRRTFMQLLGASAALASVPGCGPNLPEAILPYSVAPREVTPGVPLTYATSMLLDGFATGLIVESHEGRPTKVEGNPEHPASLGGTSVWAQALVLQLYDPDRGRRVVRLEKPSSWSELDAVLQQPRTDGGAGLRLMLEPTSSPTVHRLIGRIKQVYPKARTTFYAPVPSYTNTITGARLAFGRPLQPVWDFRRADVIVALDSDLLGCAPGSLRYARDWSTRRRPVSPAQEMSRLYVAEPSLTSTGMAADHRLGCRGGDVARVAAAIAARSPSLPRELRELPQRSSDARFAAAVARDLAARAPGTTAIVVGERQPAAVHALGFMLNAALGNFAHTLTLIEPVLPPDGDQGLTVLVDELRTGRIDTLVMIGANPVYTAPTDLHFDRALASVRERIYIGAYEDETAAASTFYGPLAHELESWGDGRAFDGTLSFVQPLIRPLGTGRAAAEILAVLAGDRAPDAHTLVRDTHPEIDWEAALSRGFVPGTAAPPVEVAAIGAAATAAAFAEIGEPPRELEIAFSLSPTIHDGRFANSPWLLELPEPSTKLTWENAALVSPTTAKGLKLRDQDVVELRVEDRTAQAPILIAPGHADDAVTLHLGWGRRGAESLAHGRGVNAYALRTNGATAFARVELRKTGTTHVLATTQHHFTLEGRPIALSTTLEEWRRNPDLTEDHKGPVPSIYPSQPYPGLQWAMSIDLTICTGCSACMVACQAENNLPIVGKEEVLRHRQMHWLRIDTYFLGDAVNPGVVNQPMMCQHCETAPCEYVCPVNATVHSDDGLNEMVYNRCVGTRFCSNNCPYKVRRFNFFNWNSRIAANRGRVELQHNPDVTVRQRGVMEKCTYCVQRIRRADIRAQVERRDVRPGEIVTACQQACPTGAIQFGSLSHPDTEMVRWRHERRSYEVLHDEGTRPRTMYLARVENPNRELG